MRDDLQRGSVSLGCCRNYFIAPFNLSPWGAFPTSGREGTAGLIGNKTMPEHYLIQFFWMRPGDLDIADVHWSGALAEAETWADQRLNVLQRRRGPADLRPLAARVLREGQVLWSRADSTMVPATICGIWRAPIAP
nr:hypothetical protein [uncultured Roseococcus sp.]